jgi:hypothetical protein
MYQTPSKVREAPATQRGPKAACKTNPRDPETHQQSSLHTDKPEKPQLAKLPLIKL